MKPPREPVFNAPAAALVLVFLIIGGYGVQTLLPQEPLLVRYAFSPAGLEAGAWGTLVTALFLHGSWAHALLNGGFALAFAPPVARLLGEGPRGLVVFALFYLACGVLASLGYAAIHEDSAMLLVGASGAVAGLMGAASRLLGGGPLGPVFSRTTLSMAMAWVIVNLLVAVMGFAPGLGEAKVAWEAHLFGYAVGLLLIGPAARLARSG